MSRGSTASCRQCRREGMKLFLKGERCQGSKCAMERRQSTPGMHGERRGRKMTDYAIQLREKQRLKRLYGIREKQFRRFFGLAERMTGNTGDNLLRLLECRLDNVVMRMGFASSHAAARLLVSHGHVRVNGHKIDRPSFQVRENNEIALGTSAPKAVVEASLKAARDRGLPGWIEVDSDSKKGMVKVMPAREDISVPVDVNLVVTYYSK